MPYFVFLTFLGMLSAIGLEKAEVAAPIILAVHLATYFFGSFHSIGEIIASLRKGSIEVDFLMVLAAVGAAAVDAWDEGAMLLFLFSLSNVLQQYALQRTENAIAALLQLRPDKVCLRRGEDLVECPVEEVQVGETLVLRPGDRLALDGQVARGQGYFDESSLTGEAVPVFKGVGATVMAGTVNQTGSLDVCVTRLAGQSTLARMIDLVSQARERKANSQSKLEAFENRYAVAVVMVVALYVAFGPSLTGVDFSTNFYRAMTLLTVASPCALVISVPAALLSAMANSARSGVLLKGGAQLENLARVRVLALDKTGTLTIGKPSVVEVVPAPGVDRKTLIEAAARAEQASEHPLARAVMELATSEGIAVTEPDSFAATTGQGVQAEWDGQTTLVGSPRWLVKLGHLAPAELMPETEGSLVMVYRNGWLGCLVVADRERPGVERNLAELRQAGIERLVMLTGDRRNVAEALARRLGLDEVYSELLPEQKLDIIAQLQAKHGPTAMVGDGINDAPALAAATVGVAMGAGGTDVALESADVVLMRDDLGALAYALRLSRRADQIVRQNIAFALAVIVCLVIATLTVGIPLPLGVLGHEGSTLIVVANGLRLLRRLEPAAALAPAIIPERKTDLSRA